MNAPLNKAEQDTATDMAVAKIEAIADQWAAAINLNEMVGYISTASRLMPSVPDCAREGFIVRQRQSIDAIVRQAFMQGFSCARNGLDGLIVKRGKKQ